MFCRFCQSSLVYSPLLSSSIQRWIYLFSLLPFVLLSFICISLQISDLSLYAQKAPKASKGKPIIKRWSLNEIENHLLRFRSTHWIQSFEIGQLNWTLRTIHTLGVGTHQILSPTGGWSQSDLLTQAHQNTQRSLTRLTHLFYPKSERPICDWKRYSKRFQSQDPLFFSDGSVHLKAWISFDMYQACWTRKSQTWTELLKEIHQGKRNIVIMWIHDPHMIQNQETRLTPSLKLSKLVSSWPKLDRQNWIKNWRTIRWLITPSSSSLDPLITSIHPSLIVKSRLKGGVSTEESQLLTLIQALTLEEKKQLNHNKKEEGGTELWMVLHGDQL